MSQPPSPKPAQRLIWGLVIGLIVVNVILLLLAMERKRNGTAPPKPPATEPARR